MAFNPFKPVLLVRVAITYILLLSPTVAWNSGAPCSSVDLRLTGGSLEKIPNFNQQNTDYCWAFTGTQLLNAKLSKWGAKNLASPTVTMNAALSDGLTCPTPCSLLKHIGLSKKVCSVNDTYVESGDQQYFPDLDSSKSISTHACSSIHRLGIAEFENFIFDLSQDLATSTIKNKFGYMSWKLTEPNRKIMVPDKTRNLSRFLERNPQHLTLATAYNKLVAPRCHIFAADKTLFSGSPDLNARLENKSLDDFQCHEFRTSQFNKTVESTHTGCPKIKSSQIVSKKELVNQVDKILNRNDGLPIGIDFCYGFLFDGNPSSGDEKWLCKNSSDIMQTDHKSLIIARKMNPNTNQCEYLIRTHFGNNCSKLHESLRPRCEDEKKKFGAADIWITSETLEKVIHGISEIPN